MLKSFETLLRIGSRKFKRLPLLLPGSNHNYLFVIGMPPHQMQGPGGYPPHQQGPPQGPPPGQGPHGPRGPMPPNQMGGKFSFSSVPLFFHLFENPWTPRNT